MKKIIFILLAVAGIATANAQSKGNVEFGLGGGLNVSTISSSDFYGTPDSNISYNISGSAEYYFSRNWGIKAMVVYDKKGWDNDYITDVDTGREYPTDINLDYITIPVMANWHFGGADKNFYVNFGPYIGFLTKAEDTTFGTDLKDAHTTTDGGLAFGLGGKIPVGNFIKIFLEYQYQAGVVDIFGDSNGIGPVLNNRSAFNIGVNFML